jgi:hypothetical protein
MQNGSIGIDPETCRFEVKIHTFDLYAQLHGYNYQVQFFLELINFMERASGNLNLMGFQKQWFLF